MATAVNGNPADIPQLLAQHIINNSVQNGAVSVTDLTEAISEVTPETQTAGPALLQLTLIDPFHKILRSGICSKGSDGYLQPIDINFPEGTNVWWRLAMVDLQDSDGSQPNLILTFQHRPIAYLLRCMGALGWPSGKVGDTRAQFIKFLLDKMPAELPKNLVGPTGSDGSGSPSDFKFICPAINEVEPVASSNVYGTEIVTEQSAAAKAAGVNKLPGLTAATGITVEGQKPTPAQVQNINTILGVGTSLGASATALAAAMYAAIGESSLTIVKAGEGGSQGVFQSGGGSLGNPYDAGQDLTAQANGFFTGGTDFHGGGAIKLANAGWPVWKIANAVEDNGIYGDSGKDSYTTRSGPAWPSIAAGEAECKAIVNAYNGGTSGFSTAAQSDVAQLERGTPDDPYEDSWTCMQRLATEVNWSLFSSVQPHPGVWGNYIYYMDGTTMVAQKPSLYLSLSDSGDLWRAQDPDTGKFLTGSGDGMMTGADGTIDNSAFQVYEATDTAASSGAKAGSAKITKATRVSQPQTPSSLMFNLILGRSGVLQYNGGDVFVVGNAGAFDGRWIVEDVTDNILGDEFAQVTLGPPEFAYPEPQANTVAITGTNGQTVNVATSATKSGSSKTSSSVPVSAASVGSYVNPLSQLTSLQPLRIDQGVDYAGAGPLLALGNGVVLLATADDGGWPGGGAIVYRLTDGVYQGKYIYMCEELVPTVSTGDKITAGQTIATLIEHSPNMEIGWATGQGSTPLAQGLGQNGVQTGQSSDPGGVQTAAGINFNKLLVALGAVPGGPGSGPKSTGPGMPSNWPTLTGNPLASPGSVLTSPGSEKKTPIETVHGGLLAIPIGGAAAGIFKNVFTP